MTDIVVRLDRLLDDINMYDHYRPVIRQGAKEIDRLRGEVERLRREIDRLRADCDRLRGEVERLRNDNVTILSGG